MFTGIIETIGKIKSAERRGGDIRVVISAPDLQKHVIAIGDSVACNGVCLTVVNINEADLAFDVSVESLAHSLIGDWGSGSKVNLELALQPQSRLGGHLVSGHVDGLATVTKLQEDARSWRMHFTVPDDLCRYIAKKGSITINGISLTVNEVNGNQFEINVIPHTFAVTTLGEVKVGHQVHIEVDQIARYLERLLAGDTTKDSNLSYSFLSEHGFT
jgi:riboflavin synthase